VDAQPSKLLVAPTFIRIMIQRLGHTVQAVPDEAVGLTFTADRFRKQSQDMA